MVEQVYSNVINRILEVLQNNEDLNKRVAEFRFGDLPEEMYGDAFPLIYVTMSSETERRRLGPSTFNQKGPEAITTEYWIVLIVSTQDQPEETQKEMYDLRFMIENILRNNLQLRNAEGNDPICDNLETDAVRRISRQRGKLLDGVTIMVRCTHFRD